MLAVSLEVSPRYMDDEQSGDLRITFGIGGEWYRGEIGLGVGARKEQPTVDVKSKFDERRPAKSSDDR